MSEPIGVGDWVECVDASPVDFNGDAYVPYRRTGALELGQCYCVRAVDPPSQADGRVGVFLFEDETVLIDVDGDERSWLASRFRKRAQPQSLFLTQLLETPADPEQVTA